MNARTIGNGAGVAGAARLGLADAEVAFIDSAPLLDYAYAHGLRASALVRTSSPALLMDRAANVESLDHNVSRARMRALNDSTLPFSLDLFAALDGTPGWRHPAVVAARVALNFQNELCRGMTVRAADLHAAVALVSAETGSDSGARRNKSPWFRLLSANPRVVDIEVPLAGLPSQAGTVKYVRTAQASWLARLQFEDWQSIGHRFVQVACDRLSSLAGRGTVFMLSDNPLLKETALRLAMRGFTIRSLPGAAARPAETQRDTVRQMVDRLQPVVRAYVRRWVEPAVVEPLVAMFTDRASPALSQYFAHLQHWQQFLRRNAGTTRVVFSNYPGRPDAVALFTACREAGVPFVSAQHGVAREINQTVIAAQAGSENNSSDLLLAFNSRAAEVANNENRFPHCPAVSVGKPDIYWRSGGWRRRRASTPPIFYVSTALLAGNVQMVQVGVSDAEKVQYEQRIIDGVLGRLPHRVLFKPYPAGTRYLEPDLMAEAAAKHANVSVYGDGWDLRYLLPDARVLIVSRGASSSGICIMSGKPVVYIDIPDQIPLRPDAREAFAASLFLFDGASPTLHDDLRAFLSQPLAAIDQQWKAREPARKAMIERFIASGGPGAGKRGAAAVLKLLQERRADADAAH